MLGGPQVPVRRAPGYLAPLAFSRTHTNMHIPPAPRHMNTSVEIKINLLESKQTAKGSGVHL